MKNCLELINLREKMENDEKIEWFKAKEKIPPRADGTDEFTMHVLVWDGCTYGIGYFQIDECVLDEDNISDEMIVKHGWGSWESENEMPGHITHWTFLPKPPHENL